MRFDAIDMDHNGRIELHEAEQLFAKRSQDMLNKVYLVTHCLEVRKLMGSCVINSGSS